MSDWTSRDEHYWGDVMRKLKHRTIVATERTLAGVSI